MCQRRFVVVAVAAAIYYVVCRLRKQRAYLWPRIADDHHVVQQDMSRRRRSFSRWNPLANGDLISNFSKTYTDVVVIYFISYDGDGDDYRTLRSHTSRRKRISAKNNTVFSTFFHPTGNAKPKTRERNSLSFSTVAVGCYIEYSRRTPIEKLMYDFFFFLNATGRSDVDGFWR